MLLDLVQAPIELKKSVGKEKWRMEPFRQKELSLGGGCFMRVFVLGNNVERRIMSSCESGVGRIRSFHSNSSAISMKTHQLVGLIIAHLLLLWIR